MRGVGKTRVAAEYAHRHCADHNPLLWARAETRETLVGSFVSLARLLQLPEKDQRDQSSIVAAVKSWLEVNQGWLLVLDNVEDLSLVEEFVPPLHFGQVLATTTAHALGPIAESVHLEKLTEDDGALLLLRRARLVPADAPLETATAEDQGLARQLSGELGGLPLALDQAGAFIEETSFTIAEYQKLYKQEGKRLRNLRGDLGTDHPSVTVTFSLAFAELAKRDPQAAALVRLCAFLAPDTIPEEVFIKGGSALGEEFAARTKNPLDFAETVRQASKFSLIRRDAPDRSLGIHRLVQEVLKDELTPDQHRDGAERAVRAVESAFPAVEFHSWPDCERILPHAKACSALIEEFSFEFAEAVRLLNQTGCYLDDRAQYADAEPLYRRSLTLCEKVLGPDHPDVALSLNNLAALYYNQGRYADAEPLLRRSLTIWEKALGPDHPNVANSLGNLGLLDESLGRYADAEPLFRRSLTIREKALGPDHPTVANGLNNLATLYYSQGRYTEAEPLYRRSLTILEQALGPHHPNVAGSLNNLAALYVNQGRFAEAEPLYRRSFTIREKALGPNHPNVAGSLNNLATLYVIQGRFAEAEPLYRRSLTILEKAFDPYHPNVATTLENYAGLLRKTGREAEALPLETRAAAIREKNKS